MKYPEANFLFYSRNGTKLEKLKGLVLIHMSVFLGKQKIVFHSVPASWIVLIVTFCGKRITLQYWGGDIYNMIGGDQVVKFHCLRRQKIIKNIDDRDKTKKKKFQQIISLYVFGKVKFVKLPEKEYRLCRYFYHLLFRKSPNSRRMHDGRYRAINDDIVVSKNKIQLKNRLKIIVCHSATSDDHVEHTAAWLSTVSKKRKIEVCGFVSYGTGSGQSPADIVSKYSSIFNKIGIKSKFITRFLSPTELIRELSDKDYLFLSSYRNEGNGMIDLFLETGGKCAFNRYSMNYHLYKKSHGEQIVTHEECIAELSKL